MQATSKYSSALVSIALTGKTRCCNLYTATVATGQGRGVKDLAGEKSVCKQGVKGRGSQVKTPGNHERLAVWLSDTHGEGKCLSGCTHTSEPSDKWRIPELARACATVLTPASSREVSFRFKARRCGCCCSMAAKASATSPVMGLSLRSSRCKHLPAG